MSKFINCNFKLIIYIILLKAGTYFTFYISFIILPFNDKFGGYIFKREGEDKEKRLNEIKSSILERMYAWDGQWYLQIGNMGYQKSPPDPVLPYKNYAFFPLLPSLVRAVSLITGNYKIILIILNFIFSILGIIFLFKLIEMKFNREIAYASVISVLSFPTAGFFCLFYSESVFFLFLLMTVYAYEKEKIYSCVACSFLASLCRPQGLFISVYFLTEAVRSFNCKEKSWNWKMACALIPIIGFSSFIFYTGILCDDLIAYFENQRNWERDFNFLYTIKSIFNVNLNIDSIAIILSILILSMCWSRMKISWLMYSVVSIAGPVITGSLASTSRFYLTIFPLHTGISLCRSNKRSFFKIIIIIFWLFQIDVNARIINFFWVA